MSHRQVAAAVTLMKKERSDWMAEKKVEKGKEKKGLMMPGKKIEHPGKLFVRLMKYVLKNYTFSSIVVVVCIIVSVLANVQGTMFIQSLIDDYIEPMLKASKTDFGPLAHKILQIAGFYLIGVAASYIYNRVMVNVTQGTLRNLRNDMFHKMELLPIRYFDTHSHGDIMSMYTNDIDTLRQMISQSIPQTINSAITIVSVFVCMVVLSIPLTVVTLLMVGISIFMTKKLAGLSGRYFAAQQRDIGSVNGFIEEMMSGQKVVKVFCHEEEAIEEFDKRNEKLFDSANNANKFANILMPVNAQIGNVSYVLCAIVGGLMALKGGFSLTIGKLVSFLTFNKSFNMPINQISQQINAIVMALAGAERIFALLDEEPEVDGGYVELVNAKESEDGTIIESKERTGLWAWKHFHQEDGTTTYRKLQGKVIFDHVDFGYNEDKIILHDIEMYAQPGQKIAFVGATGAGKTTITNLINRFYDIQDGKIRYDDINVNKIKKKDLRLSLGVVLQDTHLFTGTVADNIRYGKLDATDEEVIAAAKLANAHSFIKRLPNGYDTVLTGDGASLSQGQRQLLAIARAAIADPPALILDEATSSIDTRTERLVQEGMDRLMKGRTTFVIAHRLSTVRNSDCIMVLEDGRIIERGTHDELIDKQGKYYQLYTGKISNDLAG
jgi:ATP-binding cassette subfamily B multidrug efflux pump